MVSGCLFDAYPLKDKMIFWMIDGAGKPVRIQDDWTHSIYVAADEKSELIVLGESKAIAPLVNKSSIVSKYEKITDQQQKRS